MNNAQWSAGESLAGVVPGGIILMDADQADVVREYYDSMVDGATLVDIMRAMNRRWESLTDIPAFAMAFLEDDGVRVAVRGHYSVTSGDDVIDGSNAISWVETKLPRDGELAVGLVSETTYPTLGGILLASGLRVNFEDFRPAPVEAGAGVESDSQDGSQSQNTAHDEPDDDSLIDADKSFNDDSSAVGADAELAQGSGADVDQDENGPATAESDEDEDGEPVDVVDGAGDDQHQSDELDDEPEEQSEPDESSQEQPEPDDEPEEEPEPDTDPVVPPATRASRVPRPALLPRDQIVDGFGWPIATEPQVAQTRPVQPEEDSASDPEAEDESGTESQAPSAQTPLVSLAQPPTIDNTHPGDGDDHLDEDEPGDDRGDDNADTAEISQAETEEAEEPVEEPVEEPADEVIEEVYDLPELQVESLENTRYPEDDDFQFADLLVDDGSELSEPSEYPEPNIENQRPSAQPEGAHSVPETVSQSEGPRMISVPDFGIPRTGEPVQGNHAVPSSPGPQTGQVVHEGPRTGELVSPPPENGVDSGDHDGETIVGAAVADLRKHVDPTKSNDIDISTKTLSARCQNGHPNPPYSVDCRDCGSPVSKETEWLDRPTLGSLTGSNGVKVDLDADIIIGRKPSSTPEPGRARPHLITVPSPDQQISRNHCEIRVDGWDMRLIDRNSNNGTFLLRPGQNPVRVSSMSPSILNMGDVIDIGEDIRFTVER